MRRPNLVPIKILLVAGFAAAISLAVGCGIDENQGSNPANQPPESGSVTPTTPTHEIDPATSPAASSPTPEPSPTDQVVQNACDHSSGQDVDTTEADSFFDGRVTLELKAPSTVCQGEQLKGLDVVITNEGQVPFTFGYGGNLMDFEVIDDDGDVVWRHLYAYPLPFLTSTVEPGESMAISESRLAAQGQWDLHDCEGFLVDPGEYRVRGVLNISLQEPDEYRGEHRLETSFQTVVVKESAQIGISTVTPDNDIATKTPPDGTATPPLDEDVVSQLEEHMADFPDDHPHPRFLEYSKHVPEWGGYYVEGGVVHVYLTDAGNREEAKAFFAEEFSNIVVGRSIMHNGEVIEERGLLGRPIAPDEIVIVDGQFTMIQLLSWHWLTAFKPDFLSGDFGVTQVNLSESKNRLTVGVKLQESRDGVVSKLEELGIPEEAVSVLMDRPQVCRQPAG